MKTRCDGCGAKIQTLDPNKVGYIKSEVYLKNVDHFYCERCYNLIHYNRKIDVQYSEEDFKNNIKRIAESGCLVVNIVDILDLEGTYIENLNEYFPDNKILIVANKFDLFLNSVKVTRVKNYLNNFLKEKNIHADKTLIISSFKEEDIIKLINAIDELQDGKDVYLFGMTNVGKSSIINGIMKVISGKAGTITVSNTISTTLDFIKIGLPNKTFLIDTPGILNTHQITYYLDKDHLNLIMPKKYIKPTVFQINPLQALFIGGFCIIRFISGERSSFVCNVSNNIVLHRTKLENAAEFYQEHKDDILKMPNEVERSKMGEMIKHQFNFNGKQDITISGLGFITLIGNGCVEVECFEKIKVGIREAIV